MDSTLAEHHRHYAPGDTDAALTAVQTALNNRAGMVSIEDLAGLDQFHTGGIQATRALAMRAAITAKDRVLDVGGGLGGAARLLAHEFGCQVTVLDLTEAYCRIGELLTQRTHLADHVRFQQGDALALEFDEGSFDVVWTQHSSMNIPDKARLYAGIHRVLRPGGRLALHDITAGSGEPIYFPVGWAHTEATSFLVSSQALHDDVIAASFRELAWADVSAWSMAWFQEMQRAQQNGVAASNPLTLQLVVGSEFSTVGRNMARNLQEGRTRVVEGVFERV